MLGWQPCKVLQETWHMLHSCSCMTHVTPLSSCAEHPASWTGHRQRNSADPAQRTAVSFVNVCWGMLCREQVNRVLSNTGQIKSELARCLLAEFLGTLLFQIFGGAAPPKDTTAPAANGFALVCISKYSVLTCIMQGPCSTMNRSV